MSLVHSRLEPRGRCIPGAAFECNIWDVNVAIMSCKEAMQRMPVFAQLVQDHCALHCALRASSATVAAAAPCANGQASCCLKSFT